MPYHGTRAFDVEEIELVASMPGNFGENYIRSTLRAAQKRRRELWRSEAVRSRCSAAEQKIRTFLRHFEPDAFPRRVRGESN